MKMCVEGRQHRKTMQALCLMLLVAAMLPSCSERVETEAPVVNEEPEPVGLAFAAMSPSGAKTRLADEIVQNAAPYRGISDFYFIATKKVGTTITSVSNSEVDHRQDQDHLPNRYYHFSYCEMPHGANGCLVYAKADDVDQETSEATAAYNGRLTQSSYISNFVSSTDQIYFEPVSIYGDVETIPDEATTLADALTYIANAAASGANWSTFNDPDLRPLFSHFTNYGYDLPGSAASVRQWIMAVRDAASGFTPGDGSISMSIRDDIVARANESLTTIASMPSPENTYPQNRYLPDGAAALRWTDTEEGKKFVPQMQTTTLDDINSVSRFAYPPSLYYRVESDIWTANTKVTFDMYRDKTVWEGEGAGAVQSLFMAGGTVTADTKTVAVKDPLQYAVAQLSLKVRADAETYTDEEGTAVAIRDGDADADVFRLTGVIIGGQRKVGYDFAPVNNSDMDVKFVYDSQVDDDFYLTTTAFDDPQVKEFNTLLLQSYDQEDVNVILEFEYTGAHEFKCLNGWVYPNTRFYLVGEVKLPDTAPTYDYQKRVFTQDYTTTIQMTVSSLEKAYNVLPSILAQNLEIGIVTTPQWTAATPSKPVIMD
ncbi:MAG: hypothetical protein IJQ13_03335 [Prevotella sp.]|nr:hypothetical protein [Prevotella sp.]